MARKPKKKPAPQKPEKPRKKGAHQGKPFAELPPSLQINKLGRPTQYHESYCEDVIALGAAGKSKAQIAASLQVSRTTMFRWEKQHEAFRNALKEAQYLALAWWENAGQSNMTRQGFNATAYIFQMKNRFRDEGYVDRIDQAHQNPDGSALNEGADVSVIDLARRMLAIVQMASAAKK